MSTSLTRKSSEWTSIPERGTVLGIYAFVWAITIGGRRVARALLWPVMLYYFATSSRARRASRAFLQRVGHPSGTRDVFAHLLRFGQVALDRLLFAKGQVTEIRMGPSPAEILRELQTSRRGALLIGAHVGSFEAMGAMAREHELHVNAVVNTASSRRLMGVLEHLNPELARRLIDLGSDRVGAVLEIRERIERGEHVAVLADRCAAGERSIVVPFMGQSARLPTGPYVLAATLRCPVYFVVALYRGGQSYEIHAERFSDRVTLPRGDRDAALRTWATRFAERLEAIARQEPMNWFNFYDFWQLDESPRGAR
jgi:predicted LPLAT superfamily acyltransferase